MSISQRLVDLPLPIGFPHGLVVRERLVLRLDACVPVALVVAPAGHGKSTTVAEWAARDARPSTWISALDVPTQSGRALLAAIAEALDADTAHSAASDLAGVLARLEEPRSLVLDDFAAVTGRQALAAVSELAVRLPAGSRLTIISRSEPALALGRLRARRRVVELRRSDLVLTTGEATSALRMAGIDAPADAVEELVRRAEGWPAAIDLATLAAADAATPAAVPRAFAAAERRFADYVRDEVFTDLSAAELDFLVRTSVLDVLTGPLCDAVVGRTDSAATLDELARRTGLLIGLDGVEPWYRHHRLLADALRTRLAVADPAVASAGHARASRWYAEAGEIEPAVVHAASAGDAGAAGDLLFDSVASFVDATGADLVHRWIDRFSAADVRRFPTLALVAARSAWTRGERDRAEHLSRIAAAATEGTSDGAREAELHAAGLVMRASVGRDGVARMADDAHEAAGELPEHSGWTARARLFEGVGLQLLGRQTEAYERLEQGAHRAAMDAPDVRALCLVQLALLADDAGSHDDAAVLVARARAHVESLGRERCPTDALVLAVSAMKLAERGFVDEASRDLREATQLLDELVDFVPWYEAEVRVALARAELKLSNVAQAKQQLNEAARVLRATGDAPVLRQWLDAAWERVDVYCSAALVAPALTLAELRVLRLLPTHLSFGEIAERLFVSPNTIKTQAHAVYRKLDASSRSGAVTRGRTLGLLDA